MKKFNILITLMFVVTISEAQTIPNAGFESWTNHGTYSDPTSWSSYNFLLLDTACEQGTPGAVGASYLKLTVKSGNPTIVYSIPTPTLIAVTPGGFACSARPVYLTGKYKYKFSATDSGVILVYFTKWNTTTLTEDFVGIGQLFPTNGTVTTWTNFSVPIMYFASTSPDSALITLIAGSGSTSIATNGDYLYIDDLAFSGAVSGINDVVAAGVPCSISPNPFNSTTTITFSDEQNNTIIRVLDITGRVVKNIQFSGKELTLEKGNLHAGIYILHIVDENGHADTRQIVIQ